MCEKSITLNSEELEEAMQLAKEHGVVLAEAMTIYHMPIYKELLKRVDAGDLGELRVIQMNFGSYKEYDMKNRFFNRNLAGGALLDIGVYALSFVRMFLSSCPDQKDRSRPDRESSREVGPSSAPPFPYKTRRQEGRKDDGRKGHAPGRPRHGPAPLLLKDSP